MRLGKTRFHSAIIEDVVLKASSVTSEVTIVVPHFNAPDFCLQAVQSVSAGCYSASLLVLDDGSSQSDFEKLIRILRRAETRVDEIRVVRVANGGAYKARLFAAGVASSNYLKFLDQDDVLLPGVLEEEIALAKKTGADVILTDWAETWEPAEPQREVKRHEAPEYQDPILGFLTKGGVFTSAALYRRNLFDDVAPVSGWLPRLSDDWVIFGQVVLQAALHKVRFATLHEASYHWRHHDDQQSKDSPIGHVRECYQFLSWFEDSLRAADLLKQEYAAAMATYYTKNALIICYADPAKWRNITQRIRKLGSLAGDVALWSGHGRVLRTLVRIFGLDLGVRVYVRVKMIIRPFPFERGSA